MRSLPRSAVLSFFAGMAAVVGLECHYTFASAGAWPEPPVSLTTQRDL
jgi:hypothetical protein